MLGKKDSNSEDSDEDDGVIEEATEEHTSDVGTKNIDNSALLINNHRNVIRSKLLVLVDQKEVPSEKNLVFSLYWKTRDECKRRRRPRLFHFFKVFIAGNLQETILTKTNKYIEQFLVFSDLGFRRQPRF